MSVPLQSVSTQLETIQTRLGMSLDDVAEMVKRTGLANPNAIRWMLQREYGIRHGDAEILVKALLEMPVKEQVEYPPAGALRQA